MKKARKAHEEQKYVLLARGLSARSTGANTPLTPLTQDEMERDLRHMEAFSNACTSYAQQYYLFTNRKNNISGIGSNNGNARINSNGNGSRINTLGINSNSGNGNGSNQTNGSSGRDNNDKSLATAGRGGEQQQQRSASSGSIRHQSKMSCMPIIAMPVRIDPDEEKRVQILRQKIQQCEAQREIYEGQYLSLRAHYIALSKKLKTKREDVDPRIKFLQEIIKKRGKLLAFQRVRIQMVRETMECLRYRLANPKNQNQNPSTGAAAAQGGGKEDQVDLHALWTNLDQEWKEAEESMSKNDAAKGDTNTNAHAPNWPASFVPKIPPGVPLLLSQLGQQPGHALAWSTCGTFGAKEDSLVWIHNQIPTQRSDRSESLVGLRADVARCKEQIAREQQLNREFQTNSTTMRNENDRLVSMMALLRSETEAVVARHNVLLESEEAKKASKVLYDEEAMVANVADIAMMGTNNSNNDNDTEEGPFGYNGTNNGNGDGAVPKSSGLKEDDENDGDDEGEDGADAEEDEGLLTEPSPSIKKWGEYGGGMVVEAAADNQNAADTNNNNENESAASRSKRQKL